MGLWRLKRVKRLKRVQKRLGCINKQNLIYFGILSVTQNLKCSITGTCDIMLLILCNGITANFISIHFNDISYEKFVFRTQITVQKILMLLPAIWPYRSIHTLNFVQKISGFKPSRPEPAVQLNCVKCLLVADNNCFSHVAPCNHWLKWSPYHLMLPYFKTLFSVTAT